VELRKLGQRVVCAITHQHAEAARGRLREAKGSFRLWLGFHRCKPGRPTCDGEGYCRHFGIELELEADSSAKRWMVDARGSRSAASPGSSPRNWRGD